jgi:ascorbate-specific PTS system EIIC-type component UlaA
VQRAAAIHRRLSSFQPQTKEQELLHEAALRQFNTYFENKRTRLYGVTASIPGVMWLTVGIGAAINILLIWLFRLSLSVHLLLGGLISFFTATMICLIVLLDNPYRGELGVPPEAFQLIYEQLMNNPK